MVELIKNNFEQQNKTFQKFFSTLPNLKGDWENLQAALKTNLDNIMPLFTNIDDLQNIFKEQNDLFSNESNNFITTTKALHIENTNIAENNYLKKLEIEKELILDEQNEYKRELQIIDDEYNHFYTSLVDVTKQIENQDLKEKALFKSKIKEENNIYLSRLNNTYTQKENEQQRITKRFNESLKDYHQKNKQRLTQNTIRLTEEDTKLSNYLSFHEKDAVYSKQNYFRVLTNLNNMINAITAKYNESENEIIEKHKQEQTNITLNLQADEQKLFNLNEEVLVNYEKEYKETDRELDLLRENFNLKEANIKRKYNRLVTSINVELHEKKEIINLKIETLKNIVTDNLNKQKEIKKEIKVLKRQIKRLEKETEKKLIEAKNESKRTLSKEGKNYITKFEELVYERSLTEQRKNTLIDANEQMFELDQEKAKNHKQLIDLQNDINIDILNHVRQLEIIPLESQIALSNHIYSLEIKYQDLEDNFFINNIYREKDLINLKSKLHEHNLNKTKDRIDLNYESELELSNLNNYLLMESEKNELVHTKRVLSLEEKEKETILTNRILNVNHKDQVRLLNDKFQRENLNLEFKHRLSLKMLNEELLLEKRDYKNKINKANKDNELLLNNLNFQEKTIENENSLIINTLINYKTLLESLILDETNILKVLLNNSQLNTNLDDFVEFLKITKSLLLLKHEEVCKAFTNIFSFLIAFLNEKTILLVENKYKVEKENVILTYNTNKEDLLNEVESTKTSLKNKTRSLTELKENISFLKEQVDFARDTVKYNKKELFLVKKLDKTEKNNKLTETLKDNINLHINLINNNKTDIRTLQNKLKEQQKLLTRANKKLNKLNSRLKQLEKRKEQQLVAITNKIEKDCSIYTYLSKIVTKHYNIIKNIADNYVETIKTVFSWHVSIEKTCNAFEKSLNKKHSALNIFMKNLFEIRDKQYNDALDARKILATKVNAEHEKLVFNIKDAHQKNVEILNAKIQSLLKETIKDKNVLTNRKNNELEHLLKQQEIEVKEGVKKLDNLKIEKENLNIEYQELKKAFILNKDELILKEKEKFKSKLRASLKENQSLIRQTKSSIRKLEEEINREEKNYNTQLLFYAEQDKQTRRKISSKQLKETNSHFNEINKLKQKIPKYESEIEFLTTKLNQDKEKIKKALNKPHKYKKFKETLALKLSILVKTHSFKNELLKRNFQ